MNIEDKLSNYFELSFEEKQQLDATYAGNPALAEVKKLDALFYSLSVDDPTIEDVLDGKSSNQRLNQRFEALQNGRQDAVAHFEAITGQRLVAPMQLHQPKLGIWKYALAACFSFLALSAIFYFGNQKPAYFELANIQSYEKEMEAPIVRGNPYEEELTLLYYGGLSDLQKAHQSTFGFFHRYDANLLQTSIQKLEQVVKVTPAGSALQTEAYFFLGKAYLAHQEIAKSKEAFRWVIALKGAKSATAQQLLAQMP